MRIGELAQRSGVTVRTIRYYIEQGLLPPPPRRGRYGDFDGSYEQRLQLILHLKEERLTIRAIRERLVQMGLVEGEGESEEVEEGRLFRSRFADEAGLTPEQVARLEALGLLESSEGLVGTEALPLARAVAYLLDQGALLEDIATIADHVRQEVALYRRLLKKKDDLDPLARVLCWQEQRGAVSDIRKNLLRRWGDFGGEDH